MRYTVTIFPLRTTERTTKSSFIAYLDKHWASNPDWPDGCIHRVEAMTGVKAKRVAIDEHMEACIKAEEPGGKT